MVNSEAIAVTLQKICTSSSPPVRVGGSVTAGKLAEFHMRYSVPKMPQPIGPPACAPYARVGLLNRLEEKPARPTFPGRGCPVAPVLNGKQSAPAVIFSTAKLLLVVEGTPQPMLRLGGRATFYRQARPTSATLSRISTLSLRSRRAISSIETPRRASRPARSSSHPTTLCRPEVRHLPRPPAD